MKRNHDFCAAAKRAATKNAGHASWMAARTRAWQLLRWGTTAAILLQVAVLSWPVATFGQAPGPTPAVLEPLGTKLVGTGASGAAIQGANVQISGDGNTAIVGGLLDNGSIGAVWIYVQGPHGVWTQQGNKLVPTNEVGNGIFGANVGLSGDGNIAAVGAPEDSGGVGAVWIFTRTAGIWTQQAKLVGTGATGNAGQGSALAVSFDGTTVVEGGQNDNSNLGADWVFTQSGGVWTQQGSKLVGSGAAGGSLQGFYVGISAHGDTFVEGGPNDNGGAGAAWVFQRTGTSWAQVGAKLVGTGATGAAAQGSSVALSGDGSTLVEGGPQDHSGTGGLWVFALSCNDYSQVGNELIPGASNFGDTAGVSVAMSRDGILIFVGAPAANEGGGLVSEFALLSGVWTQIGTSTAASDGDFSAAQGGWVAVSADGNTAIEGGAGDSSNTGAAWIFSTQTNFGATALNNTVTQTIVIQPQIQSLEGIIFGSYRVVTQGAPSLDYNPSLGGQPGSGTCSAGMAVSYPTTCALNIDFTPIAPGVRLGAVQIFDNSNPPILVTTVYLNGVGLGPLVSVTSGTISTVAGNGTAGYSGDGGQSPNAQLNAPYGAANDGADNLYIADNNNQVIREVNANTLTITTIAGNGTQGYTGDGGAATSGELSFPQGMTFDGAGNLYIADTVNHAIRVVQAATGIITTVAGTGAANYSGDRGPATSATLHYPQGVVFDQAGNFYIADEANNAVRKVNTSGIVTTIAGGNGRGFGGDDGLATSAQLFGPIALAIDAAGDLFIDDDGNNVIRRVDANTGIITTYAGVQGSGGFSGDGGPAASAQLNDPEGIATDAAGNLYITDSSNNVVREVSASTGTITSIVGTGNPSVTGYTGDGGPATAALLNYPVYPSVDPFGNLFINDDGNNVIRIVSQAAPLTFGTFVVGASSAAMNFSITNNGNAVLALSGFFINGDFSFDSSLTTCADATMLNPGDSCMVGVIFTPTQAGPRNGSVGVGDPLVSLSGTGQLAATTTTLTASPNPAAAGALVTLTGSVSPAPTGSSLGTVSFFNGATLLGTGNVNSSGIATFATTGLAAGTASITAVYSGNSGYATSTSSAVTETINAGATATTTTLAASPNPAAVGAAVIFTATVAPAPTGSPLGTVSFFDGATLLGTGTVNASGVATFMSSSLGSGTHAITAVYSGNAGFATSMSTAFTESIASAAATTTTLTASPNPAAVGATVTFTATISPTPTGTPSGTVNFCESASGPTVIRAGGGAHAAPSIGRRGVTQRPDGGASPCGSGTLLGTGTVDASGVATFASSSLAAGTYSITAIYSGNAGFAGSTSTAVSQAINSLTPTTTTLTVSPNPGGAGQSITLTGTVAPAPTGSPLGTVSFFNGETLIATGTVNASGVATLTLTAPSQVGMFTLTAIYSGNALFSTSDSAGVSLTLVTAFGVTAPQTPFPVAQGGMVTVPVNVPPIGGAFNSVVTMSASGQPAGSTVTFTPATVTPGAAGTTTMMTVQLPKSIAGIPTGAPGPPGKRWPPAVFGLAALGALLLSWAFGKTRVVRLGLATAAFTGVLLFLAGCNGGLAGGSSTSSGTYVITVTGTSGSLHASTSVTIVVSP